MGPELLDAIKLLRLIAEPCARNSNNDHDWHQCRRCRALFDIDSQQPYARKLLEAAIVALEGAATKGRRPNCENGDCADHYGDPLAWCARCAK